MSSVYIQVSSVPDFMIPSLTIVKWKQWGVLSCLPGIHTFSHSGLLCVCKVDDLVAARTSYKWQVLHKSWQQMYSWCLCRFASTAGCNGRMIILCAMLALSCLAADLMDVNSGKKQVRVDGPLAVEPLIIDFMQSRLIRSRDLRQCAVFLPTGPRPCTVCVTAALALPLT